MKSEASIPIRHGTLGTATVRYGFRCPRLVHSVAGPCQPSHSLQPRYMLDSFTRVTHSSAQIKQKHLQRSEPILEHHRQHRTEPAMHAKNLLSQLSLPDPARGSIPSAPDSTLLYHPAFVSMGSANGLVDSLYTKHHDFAHLSHTFPAGCSHEAHYLRVINNFNSNSNSNNNACMVQ